MRLEIRGASVGYPGRVLLSGIDMVSEGCQITAVLGTNGAGKTSFLRCLLGLQPWLAGTVLVDGKECNAKGFGRCQSGMAYVPQGGSRAPYTVLDMVMLGRSGAKGLFSQPDEEDRRIARALLDRVDMQAYADCPCSRLSQGELQLVKIARALASDPALLVMDEPEAGLDLKNSRRLLKLICTLSREENRQVLFVTHSPEYAQEVADRVLLLLPGGTACWGSTKDIVTRRNLELAYGVHMKIVRCREFDFVLPVDEETDAEIAPERSSVCRKGKKPYFYL